MLGNIKIFLFLIILLIFGWMLGNTMWFKSSKIYLYLQMKINKLIEKNLLFFIIVIFLNIILCFFSIFSYYECIFTPGDFITELFMLILCIMDPKFPILFLFHFLCFSILLNILVYIVIYFLFDSDSFFGIILNYFLFIFEIYIFLLVLLSIYYAGIFLDLQPVLYQLMVNDTGEFIGSGNLNIK